MDDGGKKEICMRCLADLKEIREEVTHLNQWRAGHDSRIDVYWENQHNWDDDIEKRVEVLEKTFAKAIGGGAVLLLLGNLAIQYIMRQ